MGGGVQALVERQAAELEAATAGTSGWPATWFRIHYRRAGIDLLLGDHADATRQQVKAERDAADEYLKRIKKNKRVPDWARDAYDRGVRDGRLLGAAPDGGESIYVAQSDATDAWAESLPGERQGVARDLYHDGVDKGEDEAGNVYVQAQLAAEAWPLEPTSLWDRRGAAINFLAGCFGEGTGHLLASGKIRVPGPIDQAFAVDAMQAVELVTQENIKRVGKSLGWGLVGAAAFGGAGLVAGALVAGNATNVTFVGTLKDGKRFLASGTSGVYKHFLAATFA